MNDLLKFPQLPVTSYTLSSLASMWSHHHSLSLWLQGMKDLSKFPQLPVTSYTLSSLYLATMYPNHLLLSGFKECQAYHNSHSYQLPNHPCLSVCQHHSFSLWLQVMKDLLKFPQLPVTSYTFSSIVSMWSHHHYLSLASRNERLIKVSTVTSYQLHPFLPLPCHYVFPHHLLLSGFK